jgi:hypothetical protein
MHYLAGLDNYAQLSERARYDRNSAIDLFGGYLQNPLWSNGIMP